MAPFDINSRQIRVFISSTFSDMTTERDYLVKKIFPSLKRKAEARDVSFIPIDLRWGITDQESSSGKVIEICMREIERCYPFFIGLLGDRYGFCPKIDEVSIIDEKFDWVKDDVASGLSITEMEIQYGVLRNPADLNAFFYLKEPYDHTIEKVHPESLELLKEKIRNNGRYPVSSYSSVEELGNKIDSAFTTLLDKLFPKETLQDQDRERHFHDTYLNRFSHFYVPDIGNYETLDKFIECDSKVCVVDGQYDSGKTALIANWIRHRLDLSKWQPVYHLAGYGGYDAKRILKRILSEVARIREVGKIPLVILDWDPYFWDEHKVRELIGKLFLNERPEYDGKGIFTGPDGDDFTAEGCVMCHVQNYHQNPEYWRSFIVSYLKLYRKKLANKQLEMALSDPVLYNPLLMTIFLDDIVSYGSFDKLSSRIDVLTKSVNKEDFFRRFIGLLESDYGADTVKVLLSALFLSLYGLSYDVIVNLPHVGQLNWSCLSDILKKVVFISNGYFRISNKEFSKSIEERYNLTDIDEARKYRKCIIGALSETKGEASFGETAWQLVNSKEYDAFVRLMTEGYHDYELSEREYIWRTFLILTDLNELICNIAYDDADTAILSVLDYFLPRYYSLAKSDRSLILGEYQYDILYEVGTLIASFEEFNSVDHFTSKDHFTSMHKEYLDFMLELLDICKDNEDLTYTCKYNIWSETGDEKYNPNEKPVTKKENIPQKAEMSASQKKELAEELFQAARKFIKGDIESSDFNKASHYLAQAAHLGHDTASLFLGVLYLKGLGVKRNDRDAFKYIFKAAKKGNLIAAAWIGDSYCYGRGCQPDMIKAAKWYHLLADNDEDYYQRMLASLYYKGLGVSQDIEKALFWISKAVALLRNPDKEKTDLTEALIEQARYQSAAGDELSAVRAIEEACSYINDNTPKEVRYSALKLRAEIEYDLDRQKAKESLKECYSICMSEYGDSDARSEELLFLLER